FDERLASHQQLVDDALVSEILTGQSNISDLVSALQGLENSIAQLRIEMNQSSIDWDAARGALGNISSYSEAVNTQLSALNTEIKNVADTKASLISDKLDHVIGLIFALVAVSIAITMSAIMTTQRLITRPILSLAADLEEVSSNYNLKHTVSRLSNDEVGDVGGQLSRLLGEFSEALKNVQVAARGTRTSVANLLKATESSDTRASSLITQIGNLVDEMGFLQEHIETQVARSEEAAATAQDGAEAVQKGAVQMQRTATSIDKLAGEVDHASEELLELHKTSEKVSGVVGTIAEIAEQTNLLALNAAIEAARAGESGRGFAVVADEVRTLATRTHQSTAEINTMLEVLVRSINAVVTTMQKGKDQASESVLLGKEMVTLLSQLSATVAELSDTSHQVSVETNGAGQKVSALSVKISQFSDIGVSVSEDSQKVRREAQGLFQQGEGLQSTVERFKI
ncbi:MAG: methyl-accepting chemotaxis protein, partial [Pontibacterium sp.]